jgi:hypothetical protein
MSKSYIIEMDLSDLRKQVKYVPPHLLPEQVQASSPTLGRGKWERRKSTGQTLCHKGKKKVGEKEEEVLF